MNAHSRWLHDPLPPPNAAVLAEAIARQTQLTKPLGSLGRLEALGTQLAAMQNTQQPCVEQLWISIFAGDHGVAAEGISAFPQVVTAQMLRNYAAGGAAISVLAREWGARLEVINLGTVAALDDLPGVMDKRIAAGTANFVHGPAMSAEQMHEALAAGCQAADRAAINGAQLFIGGEMGIGNTTSAAAIACSLLNRPAAYFAGPGTGLDSDGVKRKALVAVRLRPELAAWLFYAHRSAEPGHQRLLEVLEAEPLLDLGMRLGEGSGSAVAAPLLRAAAALHTRMATFAEAGVSAA